MSNIKNIQSLEVLDSRGNPTVWASVELEDGSYGDAIVPSGASTGSKEALELRDNDKGRYGGKGVLKAVSNVLNKIAPAIKGMSALDQQAIDNKMLEIDGTENKTNLGANATLAVSMATARAAANSSNLELFEYINKIFAHSSEMTLPVPMMNVINGGSHADNKIDIQEFMIQPIGFEKFSEALRAGAETFHVLKKRLQKMKMVTAVGDEGGFAPDLPSTEATLNELVGAIQEAGYQTSAIKLALDCAANEFYKDGAYDLVGEGKKLSSKEMTSFLDALCDKFPIRSIEDGKEEQDWDGWKDLTEVVGSKIQLVGDDLFVTNPKIFAEGISKNIANAILIKLNQIGTLTETLKAIEMAKKANYGIVISHRSGESKDSFIADLAVGTAAGQIKTGSLSRSDRIEKYNRLLMIEAKLGAKAVYARNTLS